MSKMTGKRMQSLKDFEKGAIADNLGIESVRRIKPADYQSMVEGGRAVTEGDLQKAQ